MTCYKLALALLLITSAATAQMLPAGDAKPKQIGRTRITLCPPGQAVTTMDRYGVPTCSAERVSISAFGANDPAGASSTHECPPFARTCAINIPDGRYWEAPFDMQVSDLYVRIQDVVAIGKQWRATLYVNGAPTALSCNVNAGSISGTGPGCGNAGISVCICAEQTVWLEMRSMVPPQATTAGTAWSVKATKKRDDEFTSQCPLC
jgi:hypothetical protein